MNYLNLDLLSIKELNLVMSGRIMSMREERE